MQWNQMKRLSYDIEDCDMSEENKIEVAKRNVLYSYEIRKVQFLKYDHCFAGKLNKISFKIYSSTKRQNIIDLVYFDVCGLMKQEHLWTMHIL
jgi:hypothetical protein